MQLVDNYREIFLQDRPMMDVRAPLEFRKGAFPGAVNLPLLDDREREQVGTAYNRKGHDAAVALGHRLVSGNRREERVARWLEFAKRHPEGLVYCFRGGQRSEIVQDWMAGAGIAYPRIRGGYKAMRRFLIDSTRRLCRDFSLTLLAGRTGVGKTELLPHVAGHIDLESLARHRGSGFGRRIEPQPTNIDFENAMAIRWLKLEAMDFRSVVMEDESRCIGSCALPEPLWKKFAEAPLVVLVDDLESRVRRIRREYVELAVEAYRAAYPKDHFSKYARELRASLDRIRRRLGGMRHAELSELMDLALSIQRNQGRTEAHDEWIRRLLLEYYDPMYDYQLQRKASRVIFQGSADEVRERLAEEFSG